MTLEDVANQVLLPILGDVDPATLELSPEEEVVEVELMTSILQTSGVLALLMWIFMVSGIPKIVLLT